jgi:hypothetical protein
MIPQPTFTEHGTDPGNFGVVWAILSTCSMATMRRDAELSINRYRRRSPNHPRNAGDHGVWWGIAAK